VLVGRCQGVLSIARLMQFGSDAIELERELHQALDLGMIFHDQYMAHQQRASLRPAVQ
jgi:hypothetical protein